MQTPSTVFCRCWVLSGSALTDHERRALLRATDTETRRRWFLSPTHTTNGTSPPNIAADLHNYGCPQQAPSPACARPLPERPGEQNTGHPCSRREPREDKSSGWDVAAIATGCVRVCGVHWRGAGCGTSIQTTGRASTRMPPTGDVTATASAAGRTRANGRWGVTGGCCGGYPT